MTACQVCGSIERRLFIRHHDMELFQCTSCELVYLDPMPDNAVIDALYDDAYDGTSTGYFTKVEAKLRRSRRRIRRLRRAVRPTSPRPRFLDVGASGGFMTEAAREDGWKAVGIELDPESVAYARARYPGIDFIRSTAQDYAAEAPQAFDLVYCSEVIEHVTDVNAFIVALASLTAPDGYLYLTTPDFGHWRRPRDISQWDGFSPPSHCLYFKPTNLQQLLERHRFEVVKRGWAFKPGIKMLARSRP